MTPKSAEKKYRVIQWGVGNVGTIALRHFVHNPAYELVGVLCNRAEKVGKDAGELCGKAPTGVHATNDKAVIEALDADCVFYAPLWSDPDEVCRLLRSGKNVVASGGAWWYRTEHSQADIDKIDAACHEGATSFHAGGVNPGFAGDLLVLTLARIVSQIDTIHIYEVVNFGRDTLKYLFEMGMGSDPAGFEDGPNLLGQAWPLFAQSMAMIVEGMGKTVEKYTTEVELGSATRDIPFEGGETSDMPGFKGVIKKGTVARQHHKWTAWVDGRPLIVFHEIYTMDTFDAIEPREDWPQHYHYRIVIEGDSSTELILQGAQDPDGCYALPGYTWTAMGPANAIPAVCDAPPGFMSHNELGLMPLRGVIRP
ncbi:NAD(P)H-dependent amine dehydrogenase family protein [Mycobacterium montefiorense]|uniref:Dihydrodipicolinate reductase n=1 Tax=Mycobacterium montefiorense TaxID=154654 RepID=A0AA37PKX2_9MYCO|nr:dihydrodipicolinate reductase [Mycobacterium montefiorense]GBG39245.1 dihydrodipicolinate reductase [Mycobacterium montefiorense]GKU37282.1 dihydrodipicolinate reductase [Mycobacterium montefiorense]GKU41930.1 dihydrodipicolinate reductase [Mycobacterium montefiorense]GKU45608.1 dihydrodipicolinate reductase [Mycobacterium montefiorense]GKU53430.1 dihydrodipicolinate reductase [Mycobacterium montefiorense]